MGKSQNPNLPNIYSPLDLDDRSVSLPNVETGSASPTYEVNSPWLAPRFIGFRDWNKSLVGTTAQWNFRDATLVPASNADGIVINQVQFYHHIAVQIYGGGTNPIQYQVAISDQNNASIVVAQVDIPNPGWLLVTGLLAPVAYDVRIQSQEAGSGSDSSQLYAMGESYLPATPLPNRSITFQTITLT